jgi:hypothetical protein
MLVCVWLLLLELKNGVVFYYKKLISPENVEILWKMT